MCHALSNCLPLPILKLTKLRRRIGRAFRFSMLTVSPKKSIQNRINHLTMNHIEIGNLFIHPFAKPCVIFLLFCFHFFNHSALQAQSLGPYPIFDYWVTATHPNGCSSNYVTGAPDDSTWVNFQPGDVSVGYFGNAWLDQPGDDLLLETSYHPDNYDVQLVYTNGSLSTIHNVSISSWTQLPDTPWKHLFTNCFSSTFGMSRYMVALDFDTDFGATLNDTVAGLKITFLQTVGAPDLAGVYIIQEPPCDSVIFLGNDTLICLNESTVLYANSPQSTFLWSDNSTADSLIVSQAGTYWVQVQNICGTWYDTIQVGIKPNPVVNLGPDIILCSGDSVLLQAAYPGATYLWSNGSSDSVLTLSAGGQYWVQVANECGVSSDTLMVNLLTLPMVNLGPDTTICPGNFITFYAGYPGSTYNWQNGSFSSSFTTNQVGTYWVQVSNFCGSVSDTVQVNMPLLPPLNLGADTIICSGDSMQLSVGSWVGSVLWSNNSTNSSIWINSAGTYWAQVTTACGVVRDTIVIGLQSLPQVNLGKDTFLCPGQNMVLNAFYPAANYLWQDASTQSTFTVNNAGLFWVQLNNVCGSVSDTISIQSFLAPLISLGEDTSLCPNDAFTVSAYSPNAVYLWQDLSSAPLYTITSSGTYWVFVTNACGTDSDTLIVTAKELPNPDLGNDTTFCKGDKIQLIASSPASTYLWQNGYAGPSFTATETGIYWVRVSNICGQVTDSILITMNQCDCDIFMPNAFSPNNDALNDEIGPLTQCDFKSFHLRMFNRWGNMVFDSRYSAHRWNGNYQGVPADQGTYFWVIEFETETQKKILKGDFMLMR